MKRVALTNSEYMANLPPYRFEAGDVIEVDDATAEHLISRGIASAAKSDAKTAQERRAEERRPLERARNEQQIADLAQRRAALAEQMDQLDDEQRRLDTTGARLGGRGGDPVRDAGGEKPPGPRSKA